MAMPSTPMLDDFSRPNENPLSRNGWANVNSSFPNVLTISSNLCATSGGSTGASYLPTSYDATEVWATVNSIGAGFSLLSRLQELGGPGWDGYFANINATDARVYSITNNSATGVSVLATISLVQAGDTFVFRSQQNLHTIYRIRGSSVEQLTAGASSLYGPGPIGLYISGAATFSRFGGGTIDSVSPATYPIGKVRH